MVISEKVRCRELTRTGLRTPVETNYALGRRCIRASGVARQSNTAEYSPSSRLAGTALRHPRCCIVYFDRGPKDVVILLEACHDEFVVTVQKFWQSIAQALVFAWNCRQVHEREVGSPRARIPG